MGWIDDDLFNEFVKKEKLEKENRKEFSGANRLLVWPTPEMGTEQKAKVYTIRFLPDFKNKLFYLKYFYHFYRIGEQIFVCLCPKTHDFKNFCPHCYVSSQLYTGNKDDKEMAKEFARKVRYVTNIYVVDDPRDVDADDDFKVSGMVKIYEFPDQVKTKLEEELTDSENGLGKKVFDPQDGHNFLLKVKRKSSRGRSWPNYADSTFARKATSIGDEKMIKNVVESTHDLLKHLEYKVKSEIEIRDALISSMVWDIVKDAWIADKKLRGEEYHHLENEDEDDIEEEKPTSHEEKNLADNEDVGEAEEEIGDITDDDIMDLFLNDN